MPFQKVLITFQLISWEGYCCCCFICFIYFQYLFVSQSFRILGRVIFLVIVCLLSIFRSLVDHRFAKSSRQKKK